MHPGKRPEDTEQLIFGGDMWKLMTVRNWGESPAGEWKLIIRDLVDRENNSFMKPYDNLFRAWFLNVHGRTGPEPKKKKKDKKKKDGKKKDDKKKDKKNKMM